MNTAEVVIRPLSEIAGAEVTGVDAREPVSDSLERKLREAWARHGFLLFRNQELTPEQQLEFANVFGEVSTEGQVPGSVVPPYKFVSNVTEDGDNPYGPLGFHFDYSFHEVPLRGIMLYALEAPPEGAGGETMFSNARSAYELLPAELRNRIGSLTIRHGVPDISKAVELPGIVPDSPRADHPLAFTHPVTGAKQLFLSRRHADCVVELPVQESEALINELATYISRPEIVYSHAWRRGDLVVWDNIALQHGRSDFDPKVRRHMRKVHIA